MQWCDEKKKKHFNKELVMTKEDWMKINWLNNEGFKTSGKCWICDNYYIDTDVKVTDHCHITGQYRGSAYNVNM